MNRFNLGLLSSLGLLLATVACQYDPHPPSGEMMCGTGAKRCPSGYTCHSDICYLPTDLPVAGHPGGGFSSTGAGGGAGGITAVVGGSTATTVMGGQVGGASSSHSSATLVTGGKAGSSTVARTVAGGSTFITPVGGSTPLGGASTKVSSGGTAAGGSTSPASSTSVRGGSTSPASSSGDTPTGTTVTFITEGKAAGAMTGYGWVAMGSADTVTDPTCGGVRLTNKSTCTQITWSTPSSLCISGNIPALPATPTPSDYTENWGLLLGLSATETYGTLGQSFSSVAITLSGSPTSGLRVKVHRKGDIDGTDFCVAYTPGAISFTSFTKTCWDSAAPGMAISAADVANIDWIALNVPSASSAITVSNLCITGITFAK